MTQIYILKLENNKYYVGKTNKKMYRRYQEHQQGLGSQWTKKYKPVSIEHICLEVSEFDEDNLTKQTMMKYGIDNVRGGSYTKVILPNYQKHILETEFASITNKCYKCQETSHYAKNCPYTITYECGVCGEEFTTEKYLDGHILSSHDYSYAPDCCKRCGYNTHSANKCYAKRHIDGRKLYRSRYHSQTDDFY